MAVVKEHVIKNDKKPDKNYVRDIKIKYTGFDISYGTKAQALKFVSRNIAVMVAQDLHRHGDFYAEAVDG